MLYRLIEVTDSGAVFAFGGNWADIEPIWTRVDSAVRGGIKPKTIPQIKEEVVSIIGSAKHDALPKGDIIESLKQGKAWYQVKKFGTRGIPNGDAQKDYAELVALLEAVGIFLVPVGEIENFCPEIGSHGPKFVTRLLSTVPLNDERLLELRSFVGKVLLH